MENNEICYLLSEEKRLEKLLNEMRKGGIDSLPEREKYEELKLELADIRERMNRAY